MSTVDSQEKSSPVRRRPDPFVLLLLTASLGLNVYLGWKIKTMPGVAQNTPKLSQGAKVTPVPATGLDGKPFTISYDGTDKPTVLYVITPSCIWCRRNQPNIEKIVDAKKNDFQFIGISLAETGLKEYVDEQHLKFPVYTGLSAETVRSLGLGSTPQTIIVSPEGKVMKVWTGAYMENLRPEVEAFFGLQLPGAAPAASH